MRVIVLEEKWEFDNEKSALDDMFERLTPLLDQNQYNLSHMIVDGTEIYSDFNSYLEDNLSEIKEIEIIVLTTEQLTANTLLSSEQYLERALPELRVLIDEFYQVPESDSWSKFSQLLEGILWIHQTLTSMDKLEGDSIEWGSFVTFTQQLEEVLVNLQEPVEYKDAILIGDILQYELLPILSSFYDLLKSTNKVVSSNVN